ncbi:MAG: amino acid--tRNA ligase-related protein, partial [Cyclobacteriaceae bacterium]
SALVGPGGPIRLPPKEVTQYVTGEAEIAVVIGRTCKNITADQADRVIAGYLPVIDMTAVDILEKSGQKFEFAIEWGKDLQSEHEKFLVEKHFKKPVIITDYPKAIKSFYMKQNADGNTVAAMDILFPGIGEIVGGSQREENLEKLTRRMEELDISREELWWYLETRKFGTAPHAGFGLGFERLVQFVTGMGNIRDVIPFPRTPGNAEF